MTPVISPWVFYGLSVAKAVSVFSVILGVIIGIAWLILKGLALSELRDFGENESYKSTNLIAKKVGRVTLILILLSVFVPTENTITKMIIAKNVTYERVEEATNVVQTVYEDIMDLFAEEESE